MDSDKLSWLLLLLLVIASLSFIAGVGFAHYTQEQHPEIVIDGCRYVKDGSSLVHKGNCCQCEERLRRIVKDELNELLQ